MVGSFSEEWTGTFSNSGVAKVLSPSKGWRRAVKALCDSWQENVGVTSTSWVVSTKWWGGMAEVDSNSWEEMPGTGGEETEVGRKTGTRASPGL